MKTIRAISAAASLSLCTAAAAQLPYTFTPGAPARAAEVNANFARLADQVAAVGAGPAVYQARACVPDCILAVTSTVVPNTSAYTTLATLALPAGSYLVMGKISAYVLGQFNGFEFECVLRDVANAAAADFSSTSFVRGGQGNVHLQVPMTFAGSGSSAELACRIAVAGATTPLEPHAWGASVIALQVGSVHP